MFSRTDGTISIAPSPNDFVSGVEGVVGSAGNDTIIGNPANNSFAGGPGDDILAGNAGHDCVLGNEGNDILNENFVSLAADGSLVSAATGIFGNGADALDGGPGADDVVDYSARDNRTVVNLGLISWFNDGADPNFGRDLQRVRRRVRHHRERRSRVPVTTCSRPTTSTTSRTTSSPTTPVTTRPRAVPETTSSPSVPLRRARTLCEGDAGADDVRRQPALRRPHRHHDGNSNDGEAGEGDNTWADVFNNGPAGCTEEQRQELGGSIDVLVGVGGQPARQGFRGSIVFAPLGEVPPVSPITFFFFQSTGDDVFDPEVGGDPEPTAGERRPMAMRWRI